MNSGTHIGGKSNTIKDATSSHLNRFELLMLKVLDRMDLIDKRLDRIDESLQKDEQSKAEIRNILYEVEHISVALKQVSIPNEDYVVTLDEIAPLVKKSRDAIRESFRRNKILPANEKGKTKYYFKNEVYSFYASRIAKNMDAWVGLGKKWNG